MARIHTIESEYEYRIKNIVIDLLKDYDMDVNEMSGEDVAQFLWEHQEELGTALHTDMFVWMSEDDWHKAIADG